jgi:hypothetical protein
VRYDLRYESLFGGDASVVTRIFGFGEYKATIVVCALGPHIIRLREALEAKLQVPKAKAEGEFVAVAAE